MAIKGNLTQFLKEIRNVKDSYEPKIRPQKMKMEFCLWRNQECITDKGKPNFESDPPTYFIILTDWLDNNQRNLMDILKREVGKYADIDSEQYPSIASEEVKPYSDIWCQNICKKIIEAKFVVAFINDERKKVDGKLLEVKIPNRNVWYELGLATALEKELIIIKPEDEDIPFDIANFQLVVYKDLKDFEEKIRKAVYEVVSGIGRVVGRYYGEYGVKKMKYGNPPKIFRNNVLGLSENDEVYQLGYDTNEKKISSFYDKQFSNKCFTSASCLVKTSDNYWRAGIFLRKADGQCGQELFMFHIGQDQENHPNLIFANWYKRGYGRITPEDSNLKEYENFTCPKGARQFKLKNNSVSISFFEIEIALEQTKEETEEKESFTIKCYLRLLNEKKERLEVVLCHWCGKPMEQMLESSPDVLSLEDEKDRDKKIEEKKKEINDHMKKFNENNGLIFELKEISNFEICDIKKVVFAAWNDNEDNNLEVNFINPVVVWE